MELEGKEAVKFLRKMKKNENAKISKIDKELLESMKDLPKVSLDCTGSTTRGMSYGAQGLSELLEKRRGKMTKKVCVTCVGFGVWAWGDPSPMGPIDARDGTPTKPCPECGANANPIKEEK